MPPKGKLCLTVEAYIYPRSPPVDPKLRVMIAVALAAVDVRRLAQPDLEGVYFRTEAPEDVDWFVEKDFPCAHPRPPGVREELTDSFDAPPRFAERHGGSCD